MIRYTETVERDGSNATSVNRGGSRHWVICHLIASNFVGGPEKQILELSSRLAAQGHRVVVGSFRENRPSVEIIDRAREKGLDVFLIDTRSPFSPFAVWQLSEYLSRFEVDVVLTHGYKANLVGRLAIRDKSPVQIPVVRGYTRENPKVRLYELVDRHVLRRVSNVLCVSKRTREMLVGENLERARIHVLHNAVAPRPDVGTVNLPNLLGLEPDRQVIVAAGRLSPEKGHRVLIEAMMLLREREQRMPACLILGAGPEEHRLRTMIHESGLDSDVHLAGFRTDALSYLAGADLVVNPSFTEGLPNVVLEAMSLGRPVVATEVGGVGELISPGATGWLVPPGTPIQLADAIEDALADPDRMSRIALAARSYVEERFSFSHQVDEFLRIWSDISSGLARGSSRVG